MFPLSRVAAEGFMSCMNEQGISPIRHHSVLPLCLLKSCFGYENHLAESLGHLVPPRTLH